MTTTRPAVLLAAAIALAGCGQPPAPADKTEPGKAAPGAPAASVPSGPVAPNDASQVAAQGFVTDLTGGKADPNKLSVGFLKTVGLPVLSPEDKSKGYSPTAAQAWLNRAGAALHQVGPPAGTTAGTTAVFVGPAGTGRYLVRMAQADGGWKVDWFGIGTAKADDGEKAKNSDEAAQDFAVLGFLNAATSTALAKEDRVPLAAALLSANYRKTQFAPLAGDPDQGYDYNPGKLGGVLEGLGKGAAAVARKRTGADTFRAEITKGAETRGFAVKLVRDPAAGWVIDAFTPE